MSFVSRKFSSGSCNVFRSNLNTPEYIFFKASVPLICDTLDLQKLSTSPPSNMWKKIFDTKMSFEEYLGVESSRLNHACRHTDMRTYLFPHVYSQKLFSSCMISISISILPAGWMKIIIKQSFRWKNEKNTVLLCFLYGVSCHQRIKKNSGNHSSH